MKITIINPNTTGEMTEDICESAHYFSRPDSEIRCVNPENGPVTIEGFYDEHIATIGLIEELLIENVTPGEISEAASKLGDTATRERLAARPGAGVSTGSPRSWARSPSVTTRRCGSLCPRAAAVTGGASTRALISMMRSRPPAALS